MGGGNEQMFLIPPQLAAVVAFRLVPSNMTDSASRMRHGNAIYIHKETL